MTLENIPYDIIDIIVEYLDVDSSRNFVLSSRKIYNIYVSSVFHFNLIMIKKYINYFSSLQKINIVYKTLTETQLCELYNNLGKLYNYFKYHDNASLSDFLVYLCDIKLNDNFLYEVMVSHCYFSKTNEDTYNSIRTDDLIYLLTFDKEVRIITKYIYIDPMIILHVIKYKIRIKDNNNTLFMLNYLLFKHFFRYSSYIEDIITEIVCEIIKYNNIFILNEIYSKQNVYNFCLNYQNIISCCIQQKSIHYLCIINEKRLEQNKRLRNNGRDVTPIIITREHIRSLMKSKSFKLLQIVIRLYLKYTINISGYINEIINNFDWSDKECVELLNYLNEDNKKLIK